MRRLAFAVPLLIAQSVWPQGMPIGPEFRVNTYTFDRQRAPALAVDSSGGLVVVWASTQNGANGVYCQRYDASGDPLGTEFLVGTYTSGPGSPFSMAPAVASDASGNIVVVWESDGSDGSGLGIFGRRYASSGAPAGPEFQVNSYTTFHQYRPAVAAAASGDFVVVWENNPGNGSGIDIRGQRFASSGAPTGPEFRVNTSSPTFLRSPSVAADAVGNFVAVWTDLSEGGITAQRYSSSGAPLGGQTAVTSPAFQKNAAVASDPAGNFVIVWESYYEDGSYNGVFGRRYASSGAPLGPEFRVNTYTTFSQGGPSVATDGSGNFVVVWHGLGSDDSSSGIFGQRYKSSGVALGSEFRVNTFTTGAQTYPTVGADPGGNFVVAWTSYDQDGSDRGVFGQRYDEIVPIELMQFGVE